MKCPKRGSKIDCPLAWDCSVAKNYYYRQKICKNKEKILSKCLTRETKNGIIYIDKERDTLIGEEPKKETVKKVRKKIKKI